MFEELKNTEMHYRDIEASLSNPEIAGDIQKSAKLLKEYKEMTPVVTAYREYLDTLKTIEESLELLAGSDEEMHELANEELKSARAKQEELEKKITLLLLPHDPNDEKNVIIEIRAGAGGEEAALFVADLYRMYSMYAMSVGFKISIISDTPTELGGHRQLAFTVEGEGAYSRFKFESGVHRVQRVPETEAQGRIQTSTVTVAVLPEVEEVNIEIKPDDIFYESCKSSGAGGQHINKTESAVRLTHKPTGIVVWCQEERSQFKNKDKALQMLRTILYNRAQEAQDTEISESRKKQVGTGDRSEKIRTYNYPQSRVTDHRIGMSIYTLDKFMNGDIGSMIDALATAETAQKLAERQS